MPKLLGISLSVGFFISIAFLFAFSWYAIHLRAQLTACMGAARSEKTANFGVGFVKSQALRSAIEPETTRSLW